MTYGRVKPSKNTNKKQNSSTCSVNPFRRLYEGGTWDTDIEWKVGKLFQDRW